MIILLSACVLVLTNSVIVLGQRYPDSLNGEVTVRKVGEVLQTTIGSVLSTIDYPLGKL